MYMVSGLLLALALYIPPGSRSASTATRTGYLAWVGLPPRGWIRPWGSDAAYRRVQSHAGNARDRIRVYRASEAFIIPYIDSTPQHAGARHGVWMR
jgi:hypothetical protein